MDALVGERHQQEEHDHEQESRTLEHGANRTARPPAPVRRGVGRLDGHVDGAPVDGGEGNGGDECVHHPGGADGEQRHAPPGRERERPHDDRRGRGSGVAAEGVDAERTPLSLGVGHRLDQGVVCRMEGRLPDAGDHGERQQGGVVRPHADQGHPPTSHPESGDEHPLGADPVDDGSDGDLQQAAERHDGDDQAELCVVEAELSAQERKERRENELVEV